MYRRLAKVFDNSARVAAAVEQNYPNSTTAVTRKTGGTFVAEKTAQMMLSAFPRCCRNWGGGERAQPKVGPQEINGS